MIRQRRLSLRAAAWVLLGTLGLLVPTRARAQQIFLDNLFVHRSNGNCIVERTLGGVLHFRCPPIPVSSCNSIPVANCPASCVINGVKCGSLIAGTTPFASADPCTDGSGNNSVAGSPPNCQTPGGFTGAIGFGNISNDPEINFEQVAFSTACDNNFGNKNPGAYPIPNGDTSNNVCNAQLFLCASIGYANEQNGTSSTDIGVDELSFEVFQFLNGTNPLDPSSAPPLRTFFVDAPGVIPAGCDSSQPTCPDSNPPGLPNPNGGDLGPFCVLWDGSQNIQGAFGKRNGQFGFRAIVQSNQTGQSGNIQLTAVRAYPAGSTYDANVQATKSFGNVVSQNPITVNVTNVHAIISSPTLVGQATPVPVEPYNIFYRLSKDATMFITIDQVQSNGNVVPVRSILPGVPRVGEGLPNGVLTNGDSWNGREDNGDLAPPGIFLATLQAFSQDQYGADLSNPTTYQIGLDPLQITDIAVAPLLAQSTSLAVLNYTLTEPATVYIDVYPPGTQICNLTNNLNNQNPAAGGIPDQNGNASFPPKQFAATVTGTCPTANAPPNFNPPTNAIQPLKRIAVQSNSRVQQTAFWDGRDQSGNLLYDGNYVFVIYAALPSQNGVPFAGTGPGTIWTSLAKSGIWAIARGFVGISQVSVASSIVGSSPAVTGINPFTFSYTLTRNGIVNLDIFDVTGTKLIKTLVKNQTRPGGVLNQEVWQEPTSDSGLYVSSGTYMVQLTAADPQFPVKVTTTTALFLIDPYRITNVGSSPLLAGASSLILINYELSNTMNVGVNIYPPGTFFPNINTSWPPCGVTSPGACADALGPSGTPVSPVFNIHGVRVGQLSITEQWNGLDSNGLMLPDGLYVFTIIAQSTSTSLAGGSPGFADDKIVGTLSLQRGQIIFNKYEVDPTVAQMFNSSNTITLDPFSINYSLNRVSSVTISILTTTVPPQVVRHLISGQVRQNGILLTDVWDGRDDFGNFLPAGFYNVQTLANDIAAENSQLSLSTAQVTISYEPLRIYDLAISPVTKETGGSNILYQVSEPMKVAIKIYKPGTNFDLSGNPSPPESVSLVKRIVETKAGRVNATSTWDGTNLQFQSVPDGTYRFRIVASTDAKAIDSLTGNILNPNDLALDELIDDIPVTRNSSLDPKGDFESNTFVYPNPATGPDVNFSIFMPFQGTVKVRIYNLAGHLVYSNDLGEFPPTFNSGPVTLVWPKQNESGRGVARGIYYALIRLDETLGGKQTLQTVKKILNP